MGKEETELKKRESLRLSNMKSNELTRECVRTALIYLMSEKPFDKITVTSIIERSGISRAGFYRNYVSKEEVLEEIGQRLADTICQSLAMEKYKNNSWQWYFDCFTVIKEKEKDVRLFIQAGISLNSVLQFNILSEKEFKRLSVKERYRTLASQSAFTRIIFYWFQNEMKESPKEMADLCVEILP